MHAGNNFLRLKAVAVSELPGYPTHAAEPLRHSWISERSNTIEQNFTRAMPGRAQVWNRLCRAKKFIKNDKLKVQYRYQNLVYLAIWVYKNGSCNSSSRGRISLSYIMLLNCMKYRALFVP